MSQTFVILCMGIGQAMYSVSIYYVYSLYTMVYTPHAKIMNKNGDCGLLITCVVAQYLLVLCAQEARIFAAVVRLLHSYRWQRLARAHRNYSTPTRGSCCHG